MDGALVLAAGAGFRHGGAGAATVLGSCDKATLAALGASAASLGALGPFAEDGGRTVDGAGLGVACTVFLESGAGFAAVLGPADGLAVLVLDTRATGLGADAPVSPRAYGAVDGAQLSVTLLSLEEGRALDTTFTGLLDNVAVGGLFTSTARLGAKPEGAPFRYFTVDRARTRIAGRGGEKGRAGNATKLRLRGNGTGLELGASAASDRASTQGTPSRNSAIDRASFSATVTRFR